MIIWGGGYGLGDRDTGGRYNPITDTWIDTSTTNAPIAREQHTAVWTGSEMIVWGGASSAQGILNTGGRYCAQAGAPTPTPTPTATGTPTPCISDTWTTTSTANVPDARYLHTACGPAAK